MGAPIGRALKFAQNNLPVAEVLDDPRRDAIQADEAQSAHDLLCREKARKLLLVAQPVLQRQHRGRRTHQGRQQFGEPVIGRGLQPDEDQFSRTDFPRALGALRPDLKIAFRTADKDALAPHGFVVRTQEEMDLVPGASKIGAVKTPDRPAANDRDSHISERSSGVME